MNVLKSVTCLSLGLFSIWFGFSLYYVFYPLAIQYAIENKLMILQPNNKFYNAWNNTEKPSTVKLYLFELTNAKEFLSGKTPNVKEYGPFVFKHYKKKINVKWLDGGRKISFNELSLFEYDRTESVAGLNDFNITVINLALIATMNTLWKNTQTGLMSLLSPAVNAFMKHILSSSSEFITERRTPGQILVGRRAYFIDRIRKNLDLARSFGVPIPQSSSMALKSVGYFQFLNNTVSGPVVMRTGVRSFTESIEEFVHHNRDNWFVRFYAESLGFGTFGSSKALRPAELDSLDRQLRRNFLMIDSYQGKKYYGKKLQPNCNEIRGTDGLANDNYFVREMKNLYLHTNLCRQLKLTFERNHWYGSMLRAKRYVLDNDTFASNIKNWCFCPGIKLTKQRPIAERRICARRRSSRGIICRTVATENSTATYKVIGDLSKCAGYHDMSMCNDFLPIALSFPHFMNAARLRMAVRGLAPDYARHRSHFDIESHLGVTMRASVSLQVNVHVHPAASIERYDRFRPTLMPYLWMSESGGMDDTARRNLLWFLVAIDAGYGLCVCVSLIGVLLISFLAIRRRQNIKVASGDETTTVNVFGNRKNKKSRLTKKFAAGKSEQDSGLWVTGAVRVVKNGKSIFSDRKSVSSISSINPMLNDANDDQVYYDDYDDSCSRGTVSLKSVHLHTNVINKRKNDTLTPLA